MAPPAVPVPGLRRVLRLSDLIIFGLVLIQPTAPVPLYGVAERLSEGHFATTILIAMFAMIITAVSYGRMAAVYPAAGSAYTYVGRGLNPHLGFLVGWAMLLDYLLQPLLSAVWIAAAVKSRYLPGLPFAAIAILVVAFITILNLRGVKASAGATKLLLAGMCVVLLGFIFLATRYLFSAQGWTGLFSIKPFYDPATFRSQTIWHATSFAALTYIGFDGVTTLSEDVENPRRNILLATVLVCLFTGVLSTLIVYLGHLVWPEWRTFSNLETAFMDVCRRAGGETLFQGMSVVMLIAMLGSGLAGALGAARLLYGMGRDRVLSRRLFAHLGPSGATPTYNIVIVGAVACLGALALDAVGNAFEHAGQMLNFGAFLAFMGVNLAAFRHFGLRRQPTGLLRFLVDAILPLVGFAFCAAIWWNLNTVAKTAGGVWILAGLVYMLIKTRGLAAELPQMRLEGHNYESA